MHDFQILTVGRYTYSTDERFQATQRKNSDDWQLKIRSVQILDTGTYECQVSTSPPIAHHIYLDVIGKYKLHLFFYCNISDNFNKIIYN